MKIYDTADTDTYVSYLNWHLGIDNEIRLRTKLFDKNSGFSFPIVNFLLAYSNILGAPVNDV